MSDRHPHSSRTGAPDHQKMMAYKTDGGPRQREFLPPRAYAVLKEQKDLLEKTLNDSSSLSQQHLVSVLRKMQAGTSALMVTEEAMMTDAMQQSSLDNDSTTMTTTTQRTMIRLLFSWSRLRRYRLKHCTFFKL